MAPTKRLLLVAVLLFISSTAISIPIQEHQTLHVPVFHRDALLPSPPNITAASLLRRRLSDDAARNTSLASGHGLHIPIITGLPYSSGEYFALVGVGTPATSALLVIDTGSDIIWMQCAPCRRCYEQVSPIFDPRSSSTYKPISCSSPLCHSLSFPGCNNHTNGCLYVAAYGDGSATTGGFATDRLLLSSDVEVHDVALGCGNDNVGLFESSAGLLGLGRGEASFSSQMASRYGNVFSYCFGDRGSHSASSSFLVFGDSPELPSTSFTPMLRSKKRPSFYYVDMAGFTVGNKRVTGFPNSSLTLDPVTGRGGVIVDSGTAVSRLANDVYVAVRDTFVAWAAASGIPRSARSFSVFDTCFNLSASTAAADVPKFVVHLAGGADVALPPENYLLTVDGAPTGTFCFGFAGADDGINIWGNVQQQGFRVVYDVGRERIGFAPNGCPAN